MHVCGPCVIMRRLDTQRCRHHRVQKKRILLRSTNYSHWRRRRKYPSIFHALSWLRLPSLQMALTSLSHCVCRGNGSAFPLASAACVSE